MKPVRMIVSEIEWNNISLALQWELVALSRMTGGDISEYLNKYEVDEYEKAMGYDE